MNVFRPPRQVRMKNNHRDIGCVRIATFLFSHLIAFIFCLKPSAQLILSLSSALFLTLVPLLAPILKL